MERDRITVLRERLKRIREEIEELRMQVIEMAEEEEAAEINTELLAKINEARAHPEQRLPRPQRTSLLDEMFEKDKDLLNRLEE